MTMDLEFIYVGDPMCSWCWGFAPVIEQLDRRFAIPVRVVAGGLRPGDAAEPMSDRMREVLLHHWDQVADRTGQPFDRSGLDREDWTYDTMKADTALVTMRTLEPDHVLPFLTRLQRAFYAEATDLTDSAVYSDLAAEFGIDGDSFVDVLESEEMFRTTWHDFAEARSLGATGFPSLYLRDDSVPYTVTRGYYPYEPLEEAILGFLEERHPVEAAGLVCDGEIC